MTTLPSTPAQAVLEIMAAPFSYAQAASKASGPTEIPIPRTASPQSTNNISKDVASASAHDSSNSGPSSRAQSVRAEPTEAPKTTIIEAKQTPIVSTEKVEACGASPPAKDQPNTPVADNESNRADSRPRSATQGASKASSDRSNSMEKSGDTRRGRKNKKNRENSKDARKDDANPDKENGGELGEETISIQPIELTPAPLPVVNPWHKAGTSNSNVIGNNSALNTMSSDTASAEVTINRISSKTAPKAGEPNEDGEQARRDAPRGSRGSEKDERKTSIQVFPPANDTGSWPTLPEGEESKSSKPQQAKSPSTEGATAANKQKKKWEKVELEHSAIYPSPIAGRGRGRGGNRGGRDASGRGASAAANGSSSNVAAAATRPSNETKTRAREGSSGRNGNGGRANNSPGGSRRVPTGEAGPRKPSLASVKDTAESAPASNKTQQPKAKAEASNSEQHHNAGHSNGKNQGNTHNREPVQGAKESTSNNRDRENGRNERGRGGYRGRGNHSGNTHGHSHSHSHSHSQQTLAGPSGHGYSTNSVRQGGPFSPVGNGAPPFNPGHGRGGRGSSRSQFGRNGGPSGPSPGVVGINGAPSSVGVNGGAAPSSHRVMPIVTDMLPSYSYANPAPPFSAPPVTTAPTSLPQHAGTIIMLTRQIDYWFSADNLLKDTWLRRNMNSEGFVLLKTIANFGRVKAMNATEEDLRLSIASSQAVDLWCAADGIERIRVRGNWSDWVFNSADRVQDGLLDSVDAFMVNASDFAAPPQWFQSTPSTTNAPPAYYPPQYTQPEVDPAYARQYSHQTQQYPILNGMGHQSYPHTNPKQLTAEAPEFAPMNGEVAPNGANGGGWVGQNGIAISQVPNGNPN